MNITVIGTSYVGLVQGACLARLGHDVVCVDLLQERVEALQRGEVPFHEEGLPELVAEGLENGRLTFTTNTQEAASVKPAVIFVCVQTPRRQNGACDLSYVEAALKQWGTLINPSTLVVVKSTVPPGSRQQMHIWLGDPAIQIASNPEFLREGTSVRDFFAPDRLVFGVESKAGEAVLRNVYASIDAPVVVTTVEGAQLAKYAANTMLASRLSLINEIANIADVVGADIKAVEEILGLDPRIGKKFLRSGAGFGGSCFPKDVLALDQAARDHGYTPRLIEPIIEVNDDQPFRLVQKVLERFGDVSGRRLAIWGLAFNKGTDDVRESPALTILMRLRDLGANVIAYDPKAMNNARRVVGDLVEFVETPEAAIEDADALLVLTEWDAFCDVDWLAVKVALRSPVIFDGKHFLPHAALRKHGFDVIGIGLNTHLSSHAQKLT